MHFRAYPALKDGACARPSRPAGGLPAAYLASGCSSAQPQATPGVWPPADCGLGPDFPTEMLDTVTFDKVSGNRTKLTLHRCTPLAISKKYMEDQGWNSSLDKVAAEVARVASSAKKKK